MAQTDGHVPELTFDPRKCFLRKVDQSQSAPSWRVQPASLPCSRSRVIQEKPLWATACLTFSWEEELSPLPDKLLPVSHYYYFSVFKLTKLDVNSTNMDQDQTISSGAAGPSPVNTQTAYFHSPLGSLNASRYRKPTVGLFRHDMRICICVFYSWDSHSTESHVGLEQNHCRNPDRDKHGPWCYTTPNDRLVWDYCKLKHCEYFTNLFLVMLHFRAKDNVLKQGIKCL